MNKMACIYICICLFMRFTCTYVCIYVSICMYFCVLLHVYVCICVRISVYVYIYVYMYIYLCRVRRRQEGDGAGRAKLARLKQSPSATTAAISMRTGYSVFACVAWKRQARLFGTWLVVGM